MLLKAFGVGSNFLLNDASRDLPPLLTRDFALSGYGRLVCKDSQIRKPPKFIPSLCLEQVAVVMLGFVSHDVPNDAFERMHLLI